jgi:hypothetical protein
MDRDSVSIPTNLRIVSSPAKPLRGHQLGYRPKTNSYDAWALPMWEQYYRDLIVFGANAVELIPPRSDDAPDSPHFPVPPMKMMVDMSRLADKYGLDVWVWHPALDKDYTDPKTVEFSLKEWANVYRQLPRVNAVFVPGGDPGKTPPRILLNLLKKQIASIRRFHPKCQMWMSPQGFTQAWMDEFSGILQKEKPKWLAGIVFGPQVRISLPKLRAMVPKQYPIRHYPDITHSMQCQFPVENWDVAYALTEGRESINPRPRAMATICRAYQPYTIGSITYSEGCNDDVNKAVWSALEWDPKASLKEVLREYGRYFIGDDFGDEFAEGLYDLESNWQPKDRSSTDIELTLLRFQEMEREASPAQKLNWRFQQALYRAYYDALVHARLTRETKIEREALAALTSELGTSPAAAMSEVERILNDRQLEPETAQLRQRVFELAEALFQSVRMQLSVPKYGAIEVWRGANLDLIDHPLNNAAWLNRQFDEIRRIPDLAEQTKRLLQLTNWKNAGPGGFYDDLADPANRPHLVTSTSFYADPGHMSSARLGFEEDDMERIQWSRFLETLYDTPLMMKYAGLDPAAKYRLKFVYSPDSPQFKVRLQAGNGTDIHGLMTKPKPNRPLEFDIPAGAIKDGVLELVWTREPGAGGNGRGCGVSEVWLMKAP